MNFKEHTNDVVCKDTCWCGCGKSWAELWGEDSLAAKRRFIENLELREQNDRLVKKNSTLRTENNILKEGLDAAKHELEQIMVLLTGSQVI